MSLSSQETDLLTHFSASGKHLIRFEEAEEYLQSKTAAVNMLGRLTRKGWLQRLERGLYLIIPLEAGPERVWSENSFIIGSQLITPGTIAYWSAFRYWNWTEQLPSVVFVQTTRRKKAVKIQGTEFQFITVRKRRFFGITSRTIQGAPIMVTDPEKTLIDAADRPDLCGGISQVVQALETQSSSFDWNKLNRYLIQWGGGAVAKRLGYLLEELSIPIPNDILSHMHAMVTKGISMLEPGLDRQGPIVTRWQIQVNTKY